MQSIDIILVYINTDTLQSFKYLAHNVYNQTTTYLPKWVLIEKSYKTKANV